MKIVKEGVGKKGTPYIIRYVALSDAESACEYINALSKERTFVRLQGEEMSLEKEREQIEKWVKEIEEGNGVTLVLEIGGKVKGVTSVARKGKTENHVGHMGLGISADVRGEGLGREFFQTVIDEAIKTLPGLKILDLTVKAPNDVALSLYKKLGFIEFGRLPNGTSHRDELVDEIFMYKPAV
jgi:RimJ/RimL family protein N-acetyltransferase